MTAVAKQIEQDDLDDEETFDKIVVDEDMCHHQPQSWNSYKTD